MKYRSLLYIVLIALSVLAPAFAQAQKETAPPPQQQPDDPLPVFGVPKGYKYDPRARRDPFVNPIPKPVPPDKPEPAAAEKLPPRPQGLKGALLADTTLTAIITSKQEPSMTRVMLQIPGNKTYIAVRGDTLYDAVIKEIRPDSVVFTIVNPATRQPLNPNREQVRKVRPASGENK